VGILWWASEGPNPASNQLLGMWAAASKDMESRPQPDVAEDASYAIEFKSILLVDDDRQLAEALQWILADEQFLVDVAHDGEEALPKIKANLYDALICDVMMPRLRGDELFLRAVEIHPYLSDRFIFISGFAADPKINLFLCKTGVKYLMKPFPMQALIDCVKQLLA
jgi:DNA-binding response OmpR family regulator